MRSEQSNHCEHRTGRQVLADIYAVVSALAALRLLVLPGMALDHVPTEKETVIECIIAGVAYGMTVFSLRFGSSLGRVIAFLPLLILTFLILLAVGSADPDFVRRYWSDRITFH